MKKTLLLTIALLGFSSISSASLKYECSRYVDGEYQGYTTVEADNKAEAERKAKKKFKEELKKKVDYVKCK